MRRSGFTLVEILLVLAVLVIVAAAAAPSLGSVVGGQRLSQGADLVRSKWMGAHVRAMRTGKLQMFRYELGGRKFRIETWTAAEDAVEAADATGDPNMPQASSNDPLQPDDTLALERELPDGVVFYAGDAKFENRSMSVEQDMSEMGAETGSWSRPILFYPDGSTSNAYVMVANEKKQAIRVDLRGLTGSVTVRERELVQ